MNRGTVQYVQRNCTVCVEELCNMNRGIVQYVWRNCTICIEELYNMYRGTVQYVQRNCTICVEELYYTCMYRGRNCAMKIAYSIPKNFQQTNTDMRRLTTEICSEKYVVRQFRRCANVIECTYTHLDSTVQPTTHLGCMVQPIAPRLQTCTASCCTAYCRQL